MAELQRRFFEDLCGGLCNGSIIGWKPVLIVNYTRLDPVSSGPQNYKIMDPVSATLSLYLTDQLQSPLKIFQETLLQLCNRIKLQTGNVIYFLGCQLWEKERGNNSYFAGP